jgi:hypothetical protein
MKPIYNRIAIIAAALLLAAATATASDCAGENVCQEADGTVAAVVDHLLTEYLHNPDTYESLGWGKLFVSPSTGYWVVNHKYRAHNNFGQPVTTTRTFIMDIYGQVLHSVPAK